MSSARFAIRDQLAGSEWDNQRKDWKRPALDKETLRQLSRRSTLNGLLRLAWFLFLLAVPGVATVYVSRINLWLAIPCLYAYWLWHLTKHIARPYDVNDHRLNTRSIKVGWFIKSIFWGLDDHVEHHLYPAVPSRSLPKLHELLEKELPRVENIFGCWTEMFATTREKDKDPSVEFVAL